MTVPLHTPADLAEWLGVTEAKVLEWRRAKRWPSIKVGKTIRFTPEQFEQIIAQHTVTPPPPSAAVVIAGQTARSANRRSA